MKKLVAFIKRNPARVYAGCVAAIGLGTSFGLSLSAEQVGSLTALAAIVLGETTRVQVDPKEPAK